MPIISSISPLLSRILLLVRSNATFGDIRLKYIPRVLVEVIVDSEKHAVSLFERYLVARIDAAFLVVDV